jgi:hypothetical protein
MTGELAQVVASSFGSSHPTNFCFTNQTLEKGAVRIADMLKNEQKLHNKESNKLMK